MDIPSSKQTDIAIENGHRKFVDLPINSYGKSPFIVNCPMKNGDFPSLCWYVYQRVYCISWGLTSHFFGVGNGDMVQGVQETTVYYSKVLHSIGIYSVKEWEISP
jgi:hypothetical protein